MTQIKEALTFDDVLLVPRHSTVLPKDASLVTYITPTISLNIPLLSAAMDTVTDARLAIAMAENGGMGIIHKNMSIEAQARAVRKVKKFESGVIKDPITVTPETTIGELKALTQQYNFSGMPVVQGKQVVGIITNRDIRFENNPLRFVKDLMTPKKRLITLPEGKSPEKAVDLFHEHRIEKILVVNEQFELTGMITVKDLLRKREFPFACKDELGQLRVGAAVGTSQDTLARVE